MSSRTWLYGAFILSLLLAVLQHWAVAEYLYWKYEWFDILMHYLGGLTIGVFLVALLKRFRPREFTILFVLVAVGWEVFEYMFGLPREANYVFDTSLDLLMDAVGALTAYTVARYSLWRSK